MAQSLREILVNLLKREHLLSVSQILDLLKKSKRSYNKTSVYRALDQLLEEDAVCRHYFSGSEASYELREHHHAHLVCTNCGKVETEECDYHQPESADGFQVNHHHTTLFGLCADCQ